MPDSEPRLPSSLSQAGLEAANFDMIRLILELLVKQKIIDPGDVCSGLLELHDKNQTFGDETGAVGNINAAAILRVVMLELDCPNIPDLE